mmetsp:Transcript_9330/g.11419  ORF Transcript_9330/g.11419 Transcript_9330/m.11419 type:complete len:175 (-) Transcript_9330:777-1301(-)
MTSILPIDQLKDARLYNRGINNIDIVWLVADFIFDFLVILLDLPSFVWYGWLKVLKNDDECSVVDSHGIWDQLYLGILFYLALKTVKELYLTPIRRYETTYNNKMGISDQNCCRFVYMSLVEFLLKVLTELPILIFAVIALTLSKKFFFVVAFCLTSLVLIVRLCFVPLCMRCE